jgi:hypothetical protein
VNANEELSSGAVGNGGPFPQVDLPIILSGHQDRHPLLPLQLRPEAFAQVEGYGLLVQTGRSNGPLLVPSVTRIQNDFPDHAPMGITVSFRRTGGQPGGAGEDEADATEKTPSERGRPGAPGRNTREWFLHRSNLRVCPTAVKSNPT